MTIVTFTLNPDNTITPVATRTVWEVSHSLELAPLVITGETNAFVTLPNGNRQIKQGKWGTIFATWQEAADHIAGQLQQQSDKAQHTIDGCRQDLAMLAQLQVGDRFKRG